MVVAAKSTKFWPGTQLQPKTDIHPGELVRLGVFLSSIVPIISGRTGYDRGNGRFTQTVFFAARRN